MIDRDARNTLIKAIQRYMEEEISAFEFDDILHNIQSDDKTVKEIKHLLWYFYDDIKDHKIVANKDEWQLLNRLLLLLESDGELQIKTKKRNWSIHNLIATLSLFLFIYITILTGWGEHLLIFSIPFGVISILLNIIKNSKKTTSDMKITPFTTFSSLRKIRRITSHFNMLKYPHKLTKQKIRSKTETFTLSLLFYSLWLLLAPFPLFFQMLPDTEFETKITIPENN